MNWRKWEGGYSREGRLKLEIEGEKECDGRFYSVKLCKEAGVGFEMRIKMLREKGEGGGVVKGGWGGVIFKKLMGARSHVLVFSCRRLLINAHRCCLSTLTPSQHPHPFFPDSMINGGPTLFIMFFV